MTQAHLDKLAEDLGRFKAHAPLTPAMYNLTVGEVLELIYMYRTCRALIRLQGLDHKVSDFPV